jgi:RNA polymerase sigma-70 factor (ECF subfamily)
MAQLELIEAAKHGDHDAFEALALAVSGRLYAVARLILRDTYLAEDAVQETLVNLWRNLPSLRDPDRFDAWAYRLVVNACADAGRSRRRISAEVRLVAPPRTTADGIERTADRDQLERGFRRLNPEHRAALVLHYYAGLAAREVAEVLGVPVGTAKSRIHYATQLMRAALDADAHLGVPSNGGRSA